jgi:hypothetical protein
LGANDGASGTAVLLEIGRVLPVEVRNDVELVFFDAEDSGGIDGWNWIVGSTHYIDTRSLQDVVWSIAADLGHGDTFLDSLGGSILDDHHPFLDIGISALDIIHHNPFPSSWHTADDIPERCSAASLQIVGEVVETYLVTQYGTTTPFPPDFPVSFYVLLLGVTGVAALLVYSRLKKE